MERYGRNKQTKRRLWSGRGITLIEVLVAVFVFLVASGAAFSTFHYSAQLSETARNRLIALQDARAVLEEIKVVALNQASAINTSQFCTMVQNDQGQSVTALSNEAITLTTNPSPITGSTTLATLTVTVGWMDAAQRAQSLSLSTQKSSY